MAFLFRLRLITKVVTMMKITRATTPAAEKTRAERTLFCRKEVCDELAFALAVGLIVDDPLAEM